MDPFLKLPEPLLGEIVLFLEFHESYSNYNCNGILYLSKYWYLLFYPSVKKERYFYSTRIIFREFNIHKYSSKIWLNYAKYTNFMYLSNVLSIEPTVTNEVIKYFKHIKRLDLIESDIQLKTLPPTLTYFGIEDPRSHPEYISLPNSLIKLEFVLGNFDFLSRLNFPNSLKFFLWKDNESTAEPNQRSMKSFHKFLDNIGKTDINDLYIIFGKDLKLVRSFSLPSGLKHLLVERTSTFFNNTVLPESIEFLEVTSAQARIESFLELPNLKHLKYHGMGLKSNTILKFTPKLEILDLIPVVKATNIKFEKIHEGMQVIKLTKIEFIFKSNFPSTLKEFHCTDSDNKSFPEFPAGLKILDISKNCIQVLKKLPPNLMTLNFSHNPVSKVPSFPDSLTTLNCSNCNLSNFPILPDTLTELSCLNNSLTTLIIPVSLKKLECSNNNLVEIICNSKLEVIECNNNKLKKFVNLQNCSNLWKLLCNNNISLKEPPIIPDLVRVLQMDSCGLNHLPNLPKELVSCSFENNKATIIPIFSQKYFMEFKIDKNPIKHLNCLPSINVFSCSIAPTIELFVSWKKLNNIDTWNVGDKVFKFSKSDIAFINMYIDLCVYSRVGPVVTYNEAVESVLNLISMGSNPKSKPNVSFLKSLGFYTHIDNFIQDLKDCNVDFTFIWQKLNVLKMMVIPDYSDVQIPD